MTLQWFHLVCHVPSDSSAELIAKLRTQVILKKKECSVKISFILCLFYFKPQVHFAVD
jgi:hypothetical protein